VVSARDSDKVSAPTVAADRISFADALRWLLDSKAGDGFVPLEVNPDRSGRVEPRVRKRQPQEFPVLKKPCHEWRKQLMGHTLADELSAILGCTLFLPDSGHGRHSFLSTLSPLLPFSESKYSTYDS